MSNNQPPTPPASVADEIPKLKSVTELLDGLGLPHTDTFTAIAQAAYDDYAQHRAAIKARVHKLASDFNSLEANIQKLGPANIADLARVHVETVAELKHTKEGLLGTQKALAASLQKLPLDVQREMLGSDHGKSIRQARAALAKDRWDKRFPFRVTAPKKPSSGPGL